MSIEISQTLVTDAPGVGVAPGAFRPVFIVGCERSGTTLLAVLLDRHSELSVTPETHFLLRMLRKVKAGGAAAAGEQRPHLRMVERYFTGERARDLGLDQGRVLARFEKMAATAGGLLQSIMEEYAALHGKARAGEKTPFHLWFVPEIFAWFPEARVVGIVRDGRDVIRSILKAPWTAQRRLRPHCWMWVQGVRAAERYSREYAGRFLSIRYEDLVLEPERILRAVDGHLGLEYEPFQLAVRAETDVVPAWEAGWKGKAVEELDPSRIGDWKKNTTEAERLVMNSMMGAELLRLGYGDVGLPRVGVLRRGWEGVLNWMCRGAVVSGLVQRLWAVYGGAARADRRAGGMKVSEGSKR